MIVQTYFAYCDNLVFPVACEREQFFARVGSKPLTVAGVNADGAVQLLVLTGKQNAALGRSNVVTCAHDTIGTAFFKVENYFRLVRIAAAYVGVRVY